MPESRWGRGGRLALSPTGARALVDNMQREGQVKFRDRQVWDPEALGSSMFLSFLAATLAGGSCRGERTELRKSWAHMRQPD